MSTRAYTDAAGHTWYYVGDPGAPQVGDVVARPGGGLAVLLGSAWPARGWHIDRAKHRYTVHTVRRPTEAELAAYRLTQGS